jgi:hypothetical protein
MKWKPKPLDRYWYVEIAHNLNGALITSSFFLIGCGLCRSQVKIGNCFKTRKQAEQKLKQIKKILKEG